MARFRYLLQVTKMAEAINKDHSQSLTTTDQQRVTHHVQEAHSKDGYKNSRESKPKAKITYQYMNQMLINKTINKIAKLILRKGQTE